MKCRKLVMVMATVLIAQAFIASVNGKGAGVNDVEKGTTGNGIIFNIMVDKNGKIHFTKPSPPNQPTPPRGVITVKMYCNVSITSLTESGIKLDGSIVKYTDEGKDYLTVKRGVPLLMDITFIGYIDFTVFEGKTILFIEIGVVEGWRFPLMFVEKDIEYDEEKASKGIFDGKAHFLAIFDISSTHGNFTKEYTAYIIGQFASELKNGSTIEKNLDKRETMVIKTSPSSPSQKGDHMYKERQTNVRSSKHVNQKLKTLKIFEGKYINRNIHRSATPFKINKSTNIEFQKLTRAFSRMHYISS